MAAVIAQPVRQGHGFTVGWKLPTMAAVLWVIAFTMLGVALGLLVAGPEGALIGAIPLALGTALAGFVPGIREAALRRRDEQAREEQASAAARQRWDAIGEPTPEAVGSGPAVLLRPDHAIVQFTGRETELVMLQAWCASTDARSVRTIVGAGGVGKTRLTLTVASEWESRGREWRRVDAGQEAEAVAAARSVTSGPVLLLVDYAETRTDLESMLRAVLADPGPIRVLLVARSLGEWWDRLIEKSASAVARLLTEAEPIRLAEQITQETSDANLAAEAIPQFARALKCEAPERFEFEFPAHPVPVLVLHTAALVAVLRFRHDPPVSLCVVVSEGVLDELLEHEARYWRRKAAATGLPEDGSLLKPVVAVAVLLGAENLAEAAEGVARVPDLSDTSQAQRRSWARWLYGLYPPDAEGRLGSLQPDLLAERYVVEQLTADSELARACLRNLSAEQALRALTLLGRAWAHQEKARLVIAEALRADLHHLAIPAAQVAVQTRGELGELLAAAIRSQKVPMELAAAIADALSFPSVALAEARLAAVTRVLELLPGDADPSVVASWSHKAAVAFGEAGQPAEALSAAEEAVAIRRKLAAADARYRPELASSLTELGHWLSEMGRARFAVTITQQAVAIYQKLAAVDATRYSPGLARSLHNLGAQLMESGRPAEALAATKKAAEIRRNLAVSNPDRYRPYLASSLHNLSETLAQLGRFDDAFEITEQTVVTYRELAASNPDQYRPSLANSLENLGARYIRLGRPNDALPPTQEAVAIRHSLAAGHPDRYRPELAHSLANLGMALLLVGRASDAQAPADEAVTINRELATANPDRYRPELARSLSSLGDIQTQLGQAADALAATKEAATVYRELTATNPERYAAELIQCLLSYGLQQLTRGQAAEALSATEEAVSTCREMTARNTGRFGPDLARTLALAGVQYSQLGQPAAALKAAREAAAIYRGLAAADPDQYRPALAVCLDGLALICSAAGRDTEAQAARQEAAAIRSEA